VSWGGRPLPSELATRIRGPWLPSAACRSTHFDEWIADHYETLWPELFHLAVVDAAVNFLTDLAATGPALELGFGTGRIVLPLSRRDVCACTESSARSAAWS
jgi:hypothetical protein